MFFNISKNPIDFTPVTIKLNPRLPDCVIFDIDGTLSHMTDRSPYEWARVFEDVEDKSTVAILNYLNMNEDRPDVVICDWVIKEEMWRDLATRYNIVGMFDDRLQVVRRARALGLKVFNVEYNNF